MDPPEWESHAKRAVSDALMICRSCISFLHAARGFKSLHPQYIRLRLRIEFRHQHCHGCLSVDMSMMSRLVRKHDFAAGAPEGLAQ